MYPEQVETRNQTQTPGPVFLNHQDYQPRFPGSMSTFLLNSKVSICSSTAADNLPTAPFYSVEIASALIWTSGDQQCSRVAPGENLSVPGAKWKSELPLPDAVRGKRSHLRRPRRLGNIREPLKTLFKQYFPKAQVITVHSRWSQPPFLISPTRHAPSPQIHLYIFLESKTSALVITFEAPSENCTMFHRGLPSSEPKPTVLERGNARYTQNKLCLHGWKAREGQRKSSHALSSRFEL